MEGAVVALAVLSVVLSATVAVLALRRHTTSAPPSAEPTRTPPAGRDHIRLIERGNHQELSLDNLSLMRLEPIADTTPATAPVGRIHGDLLNELLDIPAVRDLVERQPVLATLRQLPTSDLRTVGEVSRSIVQSLPANTNDLASMLNLAVGGTAALSATALGPAIAGVAAAAYAHHVLTAAMDRVEVRLDAIEDRLRNADRGVIEGARQLADEMTDWGPPHLWPQQLRFELAIRRAALDPVCYVQRKVVEQLIDTTVRRRREYPGPLGGERFVGLDDDALADLEAEIDVLYLALATKAKLDYATVMVLLDSDHAPYGHERLDRISQEFGEEIHKLGDMLDAAQEKGMPSGLERRARTRAAVTADRLSKTIEDATRLARSLANADRQTFVVSIGPDRRSLRIELATPGEPAPADE